MFTGAVPFNGSSSFVAVLAITEGRRPPRPTHPTFTDNLWVLMQRCWDQDPHLRPGVLEALQVLLAMTKGRRPPRLTHPIFADDSRTSMQRRQDRNLRMHPEALEAVQASLTSLVPRPFWQSCIRLFDCDRVQRHPGLETADWLPHFHA